MELVQTKLDVLEKARSNLFNWRGQFTPEFVEYILKSFSKRDDLILDPFSGSGTVLLESARLNLSAVGVEINPAAYMMSRFYGFCNWKLHERENFCINIKEKILVFLKTINKNTPLYVASEEYKESYVNLLGFAKMCKEYLGDINERTFLLNVLFMSEKDKRLTLNDSVTKSIDLMTKSLLELPFSESPIIAHWQDSRSINDLYTGEVDLIVTSPPYINVFNYHQNYRAIIEAFDHDVLEVAQSEFGSNRKNRGNRFKTVIQYCIDMELAIRAMWEALKPNGMLIVVLGRESNVRGIPFYNGRLISEIVSECKGFNHISNHERQFVNKFGISIKEDIFVLKKENPLAAQLKARDISLKHLQTGIGKSHNGVTNDIVDAMNCINGVSSSPILSKREF